MHQLRIMTPKPKDTNLLCVRLCLNSKNTDWEFASTASPITPDIRRTQNWRCLASIQGVSAALAPSNPKDEVASEIIYVGYPRDATISATSEPDVECQYYIIVG